MSGGMRCWPHRKHGEGALHLLSRRESAARVALLAAAASNTYLTLPASVLCKDDEGQPIAR